MPVLSKHTYDQDEDQQSTQHFTITAFLGCDGLLIPVHQTTWRQITGDRNLDRHREENDKSHLTLICY
jgi:hypothetical protein